MKLLEIKKYDDPKINLAIEEYGIRNLPEGEDYFFYYINKPSIIVGKNQNVFEEINLSLVEKDNIDIVRRLSGGGTVFHDYGNLNYSFISKSGKYNLDDLISFNAPIVKLLNKFKVPAEQNSRNDIYVDGKKISGNARFASRNIFSTHSTLLFNSNLESLKNYLRVKYQNISSQSTKSVRSKVRNIIDIIEPKISLSYFAEKMTAKILGEKYQKFHFTISDWEKILELSKTKYSTWEWNFARSPKCELNLGMIYNQKVLPFSINIESGIISEIKFGNFQLSKEEEELNRLLFGKKFFIAEIKKSLLQTSLSKEFINNFIVAI